jgi:hypothetical protein
MFRKLIQDIDDLTFKTILFLSLSCKSCFLRVNLVSGLNSVRKRPALGGVTSRRGRTSRQSLENLTLGFLYSNTKNIIQN